MMLVLNDCKAGISELADCVQTERALKGNLKIYRKAIARTVSAKAYETTRLSSKSSWLRTLVHWLRMASATTIQMQAELATAAKMTKQREKYLRWNALRSLGFAATMTVSSLSSSLTGEQPMPENLELIPQKYIVSSSRVLHVVIVTLQDASMIQHQSASENPTLLNSKRKMKTTIERTASK